jgi:hypothetical protein
LPALSAGGLHDNASLLAARNRRRGFYQTERGEVDLTASLFHFCFEKSMRQYFGSGMSSFCRRPKPESQPENVDSQSDSTRSSPQGNQVLCHFFAPGRGIWGPSFIIYLDVLSQYCLVDSVPDGLKHTEVTKRFLQLYQQHLAFQLFQAGFRAEQIYVRTQQRVNAMADNAIWSAYRHPPLQQRLTQVENCLLEALEHNQGKRLSDKQLFVLSLLQNDMAAGVVPAEQAAAPTPAQRLLTAFIKDAEQDVFAAGPDNVLSLRRGLN